MADRENPLFCVCGLRMATNEARRAIVENGIVYNPNHRRCIPSRILSIIEQKRETAGEGPVQLSA